MLRLNIAVIGPPGAGKGTQARRLAERFSIAHVSTGQLLRDGIDTGLPAAVRRAKETMDRGGLLDDAIIIELVRTQLVDPRAHNGVVLDGFPRTTVQARALDAMLAERAGTPLITVVLQVPTNELVRRMKDRERSDDTEAAIRERLNRYATTTSRVIDFYRSRPSFGVVDGSPPPDLVLQTIVALIERAMSPARAG